MSDKWTPGPWDWDEIAPEDQEWGACEIRAADDSLVCTHVFGTENARLIAAAPDMAEALEGCNAFLAAMINVLEPEDVWPHISMAVVKDLHEKASAALAKARGET